jgi:DNA-binding winged helix-turn-helix (wHTH) protein/TolB-like protein/Tfp pilus assembly protein PilF
MEAPDSKKVIYEFGKFILDPNERTLITGDTSIHLPAKEFDTLLLLVEHNGRALTKEEMISAIWQDSYVEEGNLAKQISRLRKIFNTNGEEFIETIPKHGYRFKVADLRRSIPEPDDPLVVEKRTVKRVSLSIEDTDENVPLALPPYTRSKTPYLIAALFLISAIVLGTIWYLFARTRPANQKVDSIAVLPLRPLTEAENDKVLAAGLTDALVTKLGGLKPLIVRPAASVREVMETSGDPAEIGRKLNAATVLDGTIVQSEGKLRVQLRLIRSETGEQIWSDKFDGAFADVFDLEDRVSEMVARTLLPNLTDERITRRYTENRDAYEAYLKGRYLLGKRNEEGFQQAIQFFNDAATKDPNFSLAYAGLADCYILQGVWGTYPPNEVFPKARDAAERAFEKDNASAEALTSLAFVEWVNSWDFAKADADFRHSIELNPNYATAHHWYSYYLVSMGRSDEAITEIKKARELEGPLTLSVNTDIGEIYSWAGRYDEAETYFKNVLSLEPTYAIGHDVYGINLIKQGRLDEAIAELEKARNIEGSPRVMAVLGFAYAKAGRQDETKKIIADLDELAKHRYVSPFSVGIAHLSLGESDDAMALLEDAYRERSDTMGILAVYPLLDSLKSDSRFVDLERRVGYKQ